MGREFRRQPSTHSKGYLECSVRGHHLPKKLKNHLYHQPIHLMVPVPIPISGSRSSIQLLVVQKSLNTHPSGQQRDDKSQRG